MLRSYFAFLAVYRRANHTASSCLRRMADLIPRNPSKAYVRTLEEQERLEIKIFYVDDELGVRRWFSFNRQLSDSVQQMKERITANIDKACLKSYKKKCKSSQQKGKPASAADYKLLVNIKQDGNILAPEVLCRQLLEMQNISVTVNDQVYDFDVDPPSVKVLKLPSSAMAGFNIYPSKFELENCDASECELVWYRSTQSLATAPEADSSTDWIRVASGNCYPVTNLDVGRWLKLECIPKSGNRIGLPEIVISSQVVGAGPGLCPFEIRHNFTKELMDESGFRVVTYNILADLYADSDFTRTTLHPYCPPYALAIDYRKQLILKELTGYNADIICLQEVDNKVFDADLRPVLTSLGYQGVFSKKGGQVSEGMACFFNKAKFRLVLEKNTIMSSELLDNPLLADLLSAVNKNEKLASRILERTTGLQLVVLESVHNGKRVIVANTHLYFHPDADHVRLLQATIGLRLAHDLHRSEMDQGNDVSLVFCGDFNSCPGYGVLEMMTLQHIEQDYAAWSSNAEEAVEGLSIHNPIAMESACGIPPFTNYTTGFSGLLDYIFIEKSKLVVDQVIPLPSFEEVTQHVALPSIVFPSDHIALIADLKWK